MQRIHLDADSMHGMSWNRFGSGRERPESVPSVCIYADQRIGEILRELPTRAGKRTDLTSSDMQDEVTKADAIKDAGISRSQAYDLQAMASNPEVVQAVLDKAEADGTRVSQGCREIFLAVVIRCLGTFLLRQ